MRLRHSLQMTLFLAALPLQVIAAEPVDSVLTDTEVISTVTVTATRQHSKISAGVPVQMLYDENIKALGIQDMADAVRRFAGANVRDYGGIGGLKTVSVRNMGAAHTTVSYDGVPVSNCQAGQIDIGRFSLDNVAMISLAVGEDVNPLQPARLYGSAAVLDITTKKPEFSDGRSASFMTEIKGGSFGYVSPSVRWWQKLGDKVSMSVDGSFMRADGCYPFRLENGKYVTDEKRYNSAIRSYHAEANLYFTPSSTSKFNVKGYYYYSRRGLPGAVTLYNPLSTETLWDRNGFVQASWHKIFSDKWELKATGKYNYGWNRDRELGAQFTGGVYQNTHKQHEGFISAAALYRPVSGLTVSLAQDGFYNTLSSTMGDCPYPKRFTSLTALNLRYIRGIMTLNATLVNTYITEKVSQGKKPDDISRLSPSLSVSLRPVSDRQFFVRAMYKNTFRVPSFNDLYYDRLGNRSLRPEKAQEFDLGLSWSGSLFEAMEYLTVSADGYLNFVNDKIVAFPTTYAWRMANFGKVRITGLDVTMAASFRLIDRVSVGVNGAYTFQKAIDLTDPEAKNYRDQVPYTPVHSGNVGVTVTTPWLTVGYSLIGVGRRYYMAQNIPVNSIDGYIEQSLTFSRGFDFGRTRLDLRAEILNIGDRQYEVIKYYPMPLRSWRLVAGFRF